MHQSSSSLQSDRSSPLLLSFIRILRAESAAHVIYMRMSRVAFDSCNSSCPISDPYMNNIKSVKRLAPLGSLSELIISFVIIDLCLMKNLFIISVPVRPSVPFCPPLAPS